MDEFLRNAVPKILAGEKGETGIEYGQRVLRDHWSQLRGRLLADIAHLNSKCMYGRLPLPDGTSNMESITGDLKYHLGRADMLMKDFAFGNLEVMEGSLVTAGADFLAYRHHSAKRTAQKKGRSQPHTE